MDFIGLLHSCIFCSEFLGQIHQFWYLYWNSVYSHCFPLLSLFPLSFFLFIFFLLFSLSIASYRFLFFSLLLPFLSFPLFTFLSFPFPQAWTKCEGALLPRNDKVKKRNHEIRVWMWRGICLKLCSWGKKKISTPGLHPFFPVSFSVQNGKMPPALKKRSTANPSLLYIKMSCYK